MRKVGNCGEQYRFVLTPEIELQNGRFPRKDRGVKNASDTTNQGFSGTFLDQIFLRFTVSVRVQIASGTTRKMAQMYAGVNSIADTTR